MRTHEIERILPEGEQLYRLKFVEDDMYNDRQCPELGVVQTGSKRLYAILYQYFESDDCFWDYKQYFDRRLAKGSSYFNTNVSGRYRIAELRQTRINKGDGSDFDKRCQGIFSRLIEELEEP